LLIVVAFAGAALGSRWDPERGRAEAARPAAHELIAGSIRTRIAGIRAVTDVGSGGTRVYRSLELPGFYLRRFYQPAWSDERGPTRLADELVTVIRQAKLEGLRPEDYPLRNIETLLAAVRDDVHKGGEIVPGAWAELDLLLTDTFLSYAAHLLAGRVNPEVLAPTWKTSRRSADLAAVLEAALSSGDIAGTFASLAPPYSGFRRLREALVHQRDVAGRGGWPSVPDGPTLKVGDHDSSVVALRERLRLGGDLEPVAGEMDPELFDEALDLGLKRFQRRHGLKAHGALDAATRAELNVSAERRVEQLELNLERWRWLPQDLGRRHILVNIPAFELQVVEDDSVALRMRVMVGRPDWQTPVFSGSLQYVVFNPNWSVPNNIAVEELLPRIQNDISYLAHQNMRVFQGSGSEAQEIDPASVDWAAVTPEAFPFRLVQDPGPLNALGRVKFMFPNPFNVYLHDTPSRRLFEKTERNLSHGCIRIEKAIALAEYLFRQDSTWDRKAILRTLDEEGELAVPLRQPLPVHILYWTAWADPDGTIQFRRDINDADRPLAEALRAQQLP
jgi:murein L,D-transpeptidase YcbB/YkuD